MRKIALITAIAILAPLILFGFIGCMKKPDHSVSLEDLGPQTTFDEIQKAAVSDVPPDPTTVKLGQYVSMDVSQMIDTQIPTTLSQRLDTVTSYDATTNPNEIKWTFLVDSNELNSSGIWQNSKQYFDLVYEKTTQQNTATPSKTANGSSPASASSKISNYSLKALQTSDSSSPVKVTYHNLKREDGFLPAPLLVQSRPDCGGLKDCARGLRFTRVSFDRVLWDSEDRPTKTSYRITYSPDIPTYIADWSHPEGIYPSNQFEFCAQTWVTVSNGTQTQNVPVQQCADIRDFQFGHD